MKRILFGILTTLLAVLLSIGLWQVISPFFEMEQADANRIGRGLSISSVFPLLAYLTSSFAALIRYRQRLDTCAYQPITHPVSLIITAALQVLTMVFLGRPTGDIGDANTAFGVAIFTVVILGLLGLVLGYIWGRVLPGKTRLPFTSND